MSDIRSITSDQAAPFVAEYLTKRGKEFNGDPNDGQLVHWMGCYYKGELTAVLALVPYPNKEMVHLMYLLGKGKYSKKAVSLLYKWAMQLRNVTTFVHIHDRYLMERLQRDGWKVLHAPVGKTFMGRF